MPGWMEISGYMRMKDGQTFGESKAFWCRSGLEPEENQYDQYTLKGTSVALSLLCVEIVVGKEDSRP